MSIQYIKADPTTVGKADNDELQTPPPHLTKTQLVELPASTPSRLLRPASESSPPLWATLSGQETHSSLSRPLPTRSVTNHELRTRFRLLWTVCLWLATREINMGLCRNQQYCSPKPKTLHEQTTQRETLARRHTV